MLRNDPKWVSGQIGHTDVTFTLNTYAKALQRREWLSETAQAAYDAALDWAVMGRKADSADSEPVGITG